MIAALVMSMLFLSQGYKDAPFQGWDQDEERGSTRLIYFSKTSDSPWNFSPGQVAIEYGKPEWKDAYREKFDDLTLGRRWRMGKNYWTNLDTRFPITIGGTRIERGIYYVVLQRSKDDEWHLVMLDPNSTTDLKIDAWHVNRKQSPEGIQAPLKWKKVEEVASHLEISFDMDPKDKRKAELQIRFGPYRLFAPVEVLFEGRQVSSKRY